MHRTTARPTSATGPSATDNAVARLFTAHYAKFVSAARRILRDADDAEDAVSVAFTHLLLAARNGASVSAPYGLTVLRNVCFKMTAAAKRMERLPDNLPPGSGRYECFSVASAEDLVLILVSAGQLLTRRELAVLRLLAAGFSYAEVATRLQISVNTVKAHVREAKRRVREATRRERERERERERARARTTG
jgi:RNA polymerase sigma factor (sigma-70 family)